MNSDNINDQLNDELCNDLNDDILKFINSKKLSKKIKISVIFEYYIQILNSFSVKINNKFINIDNKDNILINAINIVYNLYFILILYTNNIKVTIFLLERSLLLYSEFIIMSNDSSIINDICFTPNINDAIFFVYKKTLGNLQINNIVFKKELIKLKKISKLYKDIIILILNKKNLNKTQYIIKFNSYLKNDIFNTLKLNNTFFDFLLQKYYNIINISINFDTKIILIKIITTLIFNIKNNSSKLCLLNDFALKIKNCKYHNYENYNNTNIYKYYSKLFI